MNICCPSLFFRPSTMHVVIQCKRKNVLLTCLSLSSLLPPLKVNLPFLHPFPSVLLLLLSWKVNNLSSVCVLRFVYLDLPCHGFTVIFLFSATSLLPKPFEGKSIWMPVGAFFLFSSLVYSFVLYCPSLWLHRLMCVHVLSLMWSCVNRSKSGSKTIGTNARDKPRKRLWVRVHLPQDPVKQFQGIQAVIIMSIKVMEAVTRQMLPMETHLRELTSQSLLRLPLLERLQFLFWSKMVRVMTMPWFRQPMQQLLQPLPTQSQPHIIITITLLVRQEMPWHPPSVILGN